MTLKFSVASRNAQADAHETTIGASPKLRVYGGLAGSIPAEPADCAAAAAGTVLVEIPLPADWMGAASAGVKAMAGTWQGTASAAGYASHYRIYDSAGTTCHEQDNCCQPHAVSTPVTVGMQMSNAGNAYRCTTAGTTGAASAPTGTGTGIADGTVVWNYIGTKGAELQNTNIAAGQTVTVTTKTVTWGGA